MYRDVTTWHHANLRPCAVASPVSEWGCAWSNHRRIRRKPLASPGQPWERRPATRGFACRRISCRVVKDSRRYSVWLEGRWPALSLTLVRPPKILGEKKIPGSVRLLVILTELFDWHARASEWQIRKSTSGDLARIGTEREIMPNRGNPQCLFFCLRTVQVSFSSPTNLYSLFNDNYLYTRHPPPRVRACLMCAKCAWMWVCLLIEICLASFFNADVSMYIFNGFALQLRSIQYYGPQKDVICARISRRNYFSMIVF